MENIAVPRLIEPNVKYYLHDTLKRCREIRVTSYSTIFNLSILALFVGIFGLALYYCHTNKKTPEELRQKMIHDQEYILSKIRFYQSEKHKATTSNLTNLPVS